MARPRTYSINEDYFNQPMNIRQAYILGLVLSDAHINYERGQFQYVCKKDDIELIEFIKSEFQSTHPIKEYTVKGRPYVRYSISNKILVRSLIEKFDLPHRNKSHNNLRLPKIDESFMNHFLRGLFDGDGSIWKGIKDTTFRCNFCGGYNLMKEIQEFFKTRLGVNFYFRFRYSNKNKNSCSITANGNRNVSKIFSYLYQNSQSHLDRKYKLFAESDRISNENKKRMCEFNGMGEKIEKMYSQKTSQKKISDILMIKYSTVRGHIRKLRKLGKVV